MQVVHRVARILQALKGQRDGLTLSQIATRVELPRSTVHRLVTALEAEGLVASASVNGGYRLGPVLAGLALVSEQDLALVAHPYLVELSREVDETVDLAVLHHDHVLFVDHIDAPRRLRAVSAVGALFPAYCTANGKALLSTLPDDEVVSLLPRRLEPLTRSTITDHAALLEELAEVRRTGVAYDREEHTVGISAVGATIADAAGRIAAISIPVPAQRFAGNEGTLSERLVAACAAITAALGSR